MERFLHGDGNVNNKTKTKKKKKGVKRILKNIFNSNNEVDESLVAQLEGIQPRKKEFENVDIPNRQPPQKRIYENRHQDNRGHQQRRQPPAYSNNLQSSSQNNNNPRRQQYNRSNNDQYPERQFHSNNQPDLRMGKKNIVRGNKRIGLQLERPKPLPGKSNSLGSDSIIQLGELSTSPEGGWFDSIKLEKNFRFSNSEKKSTSSDQPIFEVINMEGKEREEEKKRNNMDSGVSFLLHGLSNYKKTAFMNATIQLLHFCYSHMTKEEKTQFKSSEFSSRMTEFFKGGTVSQEEMYGIIEALTGLNDQQEQQKKKSLVDFLNNLFRVFEPRSLISFSLRNIVEKKHIDEVSGKPVFQRKQCYLPIISISNVKVDSLQQGLIYFINSYGFPDKSFEIFPKFLIVECCFTEQIKEKKVSFYGFQKQTEYEIQAIVVLSQSQYSAIIKEGEYFYLCSDSRIQRVGGFNSVPCNFTNLILLKKIELPPPPRINNLSKNNNKKKKTTEMNNNNKEEIEKKKKEEDKNNKKNKKNSKPVLKVVRKFEKESKIFLRFDGGRPYAKVRHTQSCPIKKCKTFLKYICNNNSYVDDSKYVECTKCSHVFCWICRKDTPTCKSNSSDYKGDCL